MVFCGSYKKSNARKLSVELIDVVIHRSVHGDPESKVPSFKDVKALDAFLHSLYNAVGYLSLMFDREGGEKAFKAYVNNKISETILFNSIDELVKKSTDGDPDGLVPYWRNFDDLHAFLGELYDEIRDIRMYFRTLRAFIDCVELKVFERVDDSKKRVQMMCLIEPY